MCFSQYINDSKIRKRPLSPFKKEWSHFSSELKDKALAEQIKFEDYYAEIRK